MPRPPASISEPPRPRASTASYRTYTHDAPLGRHLTRSSTITQPLPFVHPTRVEFYPEDGAGPAVWSSRASRKSRRSSVAIEFVHEHAGAGEGSAASGEFSRHARVMPKLQRPGNHLQPHILPDISFWVAIWFTFGSIAWVINGFLLFLPLLGDAGDNSSQAAAWGFVGGTSFEIGAYLQYIEAINSGHEKLFAKAIWGVIGWRHRHPSKGSDTLPADPEKDADSSTSSEEVRFRWWGMGDWREIAVSAAAIQLFSASIFWVSTLTGLPGVISGFPDDPPTAITDVLFWTPQVIGGTGFIIASFLLMIEDQKSFFIPNLFSFGWQVGFWNLVGAVGFTLCGALGYAALTKTWINYQSVLSTFWGGWGFLIGSCIQLWEVVFREPPSK
ncbi:hypothetical protein BC834DRAFT_867615 [Gloeopeniophorella convolvens]|nr:hypothetical protein BC834DRAFT_867615 [Gloeopeniophorella convolvens]